MCCSCLLKGKYFDQPTNQPNVAKTFSEKQSETIFAKLESTGIPIDESLRKSIQDKISEISNYTPKVGVFGKTGVGKSSLCNALFGADLCAISDVAACTRNPQEVLLNMGSSGGGGITLLDVPGVGESRDRDNEYDELYKKLLPELDLILWVFKGDDRANASDEDFYSRLVRPYINEGKAFLAVVNQVDKIEPFREWNEELCVPGVKQNQNIKAKCSYIASFLKLPVRQVIPVSAGENYNLVELVDAIVHELPNEQKAIVLYGIQTAEDIRKQAAQEAADLARKEADELSIQTKKAHEAALNAKEEERKEMQRKAEEAEKRQKEAEAKAELERKRADDESRRTIISERSEKEAEGGFWSGLWGGVKSVVSNVFGSWWPF